MEITENKMRKLMDLLGQKKELLIKLLDLYQYHEKFCREEKLDKLNRLINSQSLKVDKLKRIDEKVEKIIDNVSEIVELEEINIENIDINNGILSRLKSKKNEIDNLIIEIYKTDQEKRKIVMSKYKELRKKVISINQARKVRNEYIKKPVNTGGVFVDRREKPVNRRKNL